MSGCSSLVVISSSPWILMCFLAFNLNLMSSSMKVPKKHKKPRMAKREIMMMAPVENGGSTFCYVCIYAMHRISKVKVEDKDVQVF